MTWQQFMTKKDTEIHIFWRQPLVIIYCRFTSKKPAILLFSIENGRDNRSRGGETKHGANVGFGMRQTSSCRLRQWTLLWVRPWPVPRCRYRSPPCRQSTRGCRNGQNTRRDAQRLSTLIIWSLDSYDKWSDENGCSRLFEKDIIDILNFHL